MHRFAACFSLFLTVAIPHQAEAAFADDEVLLYAFDGSTASTEATEDNATGLDLTLNGATLSDSQTLDTLLAKSWDSGNSLYCDGTTARATHSDNNTFEPGDLTLSAWVYIPTFSDCNGNCTIVSKGNNGSNPNGYWFYVDQVGGLTVVIANGGSSTTVSGGTLSQGTWHHVVTSLKGQTVSLYLDGQIKALTTMSHYVAYSSEEFMVCGIDSSTDYFKGYVDELRLWDGDMSSTEVADFYDWYTDSDSDGYNASDDCDMDDSSIYPGADETCDSVDNDCDGTIDESDAIDASTWYLDDDLDGYGDSTNSTPSCDQPSGYVADDTDCDDSEASTNPGADETCDTIDNDCDGTTDESDAVDADLWYADVDNDGYGDNTQSQAACTQPSGTVSDNTDCDDGDPDTNPGADEYCDGHDDDCDNLIDESDAVDVSTWYADTDSDGYGNSTASTQSCSQPANYVADDTDCNDNAFGINPGVDEYCDGHDDDCDGTIDEDDALDADTYYSDSDGDGYGDPNSSTTSCSTPSNHVSNDNDCDDADSNSYPGADEYCDNEDNDCDGTIDEDDAVDVQTWYADTDSDGFGDITNTDIGCSPPSGYLSDDTDCDDTDSSIYPGADEYCDSVDNNCNAIVDEDTAVDAEEFYADTDGDGFGDLGNPKESCSQPSGYLTDNTDCNDGNASIYPGAPESCDSIDWDCDGEVDDDESSDALTWYADSDSDGYGDANSTTQACSQPSGYLSDDTDCDDTDSGVSPIATEVWYDGIDQDCNGASDYDQDLDGYDHEDYQGEDCDDEDDTINPDATESYYDGIDQDCDGASDYDYDGDGFDSESYGGDDCDDADEETYPGAPDIPYDGLITDCDHSSDYDADGDGWDTNLFGGEDCDDNNSDISPDAEEIWYDGIDQDCDGNDDDQDEDGYPLEEDCDDEDASVYPNAPGLDENCDPIDTADTAAPTDSGSTSDTGQDDSSTDKGGGGNTSFTGPGEDSGCACSSPSSPRSSWWILALALVVVGRRRSQVRRAS